MALIEKFERELRLRNFSPKTVKSYIWTIEQFLKYSKGKELNEDIVKEYILKKLSKHEPSSISHDISVITFFFNKILIKRINIPHPKRNKKIPEVLTSKEIREMINGLKNKFHLTHFSSP